MATITDKHVEITCKIGQQEKTCRYLLMGHTGWECGKKDLQIKQIIDNKVATMSAKADNCNGV
jgi:hypothetical protein